MTEARFEQADSYYPVDLEDRLSKEAIPFDSRRVCRPLGLTTVIEAYYECFEGGANRFQGDRKEIASAKESFIRAVLNNPDVTLQDVVEFIADKAIYSRIIESYAYSGPSDD